MLQAILITECDRIFSQPNDYEGRSPIYASKCDKTIIICHFSPGAKIGSFFSCFIGAKPTSGKESPTKAIVMGMITFSLH